MSCHRARTGLPSRGFSTGSQHTTSISRSDPRRSFDGNFHTNHIGIERIAQHLLRVEVLTAPLSDTTLQRTQLTWRKLTRALLLQPLEELLGRLRRVDLKAHP